MYKSETIIKYLFVCLNSQRVEIFVKTTNLMFTPVETKNRLFFFFFFFFFLFFFFFFFFFFVFFFFHFGTLNDRINNVLPKWADSLCLLKDVLQLSRFCAHDKSG